MKRWSARACVAVAVAAISMSHAFAGANRVGTELIVDVSSIERGGTFRVGLRFTIEPHAHIYWRNPGTSGIETGIAWDLPEGFSVGELQWPNPKRFEIPEIDDISYGYEREVVLFVEVTAPQTLPDSFAITAEAYWLVCLKSGQCIPETVTQRIEVPGARIASETMDAHAARVPRAVGAGEVSYEQSSGRIVFTTSGPWDFTPVDLGAGHGFFPGEGDAWDAEARQAGRLAFVLKGGEGAPGTVGGVATLSLRNRESDEIKTVYLRVKE